MNKRLPPLSALMYGLWLSSAAHSADFGDWAEKKETPSTSSPKRNVWGSHPNLKEEVQPTLTALRQENEELRRLLAEKATAALPPPREEPVAYPVLSFRWINLFNGYPDTTSANYDPRTRQYYDASSGGFPSQQPLHPNLKNILGPEVKAWEVRVNAAREAYKAAYQDWQYKQKRYLRKVREDLAHTTQQLETLTDSLILPNPQTNSTSIQEVAKESKSAEILQRAKTDAENAERVFKDMQKSLVAAHPTECKIIGEDERQLTFLTVDELEKRLIWGFIEKPLATPYRTSTGKRHDPKNIRGFVLADPVDIRIGIHTLSWMIPHLKKELAIFEDIFTLYNKNVIPNTSNFLSLDAWRDWQNSTSANQLKEHLKTAYPFTSIAKFQMPRTDQEETSRLLRRDELGFKLRSAYIDHIKRYLEIEIHNLSDSFFNIYTGLDRVTETDTKTTSTAKKLGEKRVFPKPLSTPFLSVQARVQPAILDEDSLLPDAVMPFIIPKKAQMATEYPSPKAMGFHRNFWPDVMRELSTKGKRVLKPSSSGVGGAAEYVQLYSQYEKAVEDIRLYFASLHKAKSSNLKLLFEFFLTTPLQPQQIASEMVIELAELGITDLDLTNLRLLPSNQSEPVLRRYSQINLANNALQSPNPNVFNSSLVSLNVSHNRLHNLEFAVPLTELKILDVSAQMLNSVAPFGNEGVTPLLKLEQLNLAHTGLSQIVPLAGFSSLRILDLSKNNIVTVTPLKELKTLEELDLEQNQIKDIGDLESLYKLRKFNISRNPLGTLKSVAKLEALEILIANQCQFQGFWPVVLPIVKGDADPQPKTLTHLHLKGNPGLIWLPYTKKSSHSSVDVKNNDSDFNTSFPGLQVLEVEHNAQLKAVPGKPITLSALERRF